VNNSAEKSEPLADVAPVGQNVLPAAWSSRIATRTPAKLGGFLEARLKQSF